MARNVLTAVTMLSGSLGMSIPSDAIARQKPGTHSKVVKSGKARNGRAVRASNTLESNKTEIPGKDAQQNELANSNTNGSSGEIVSRNQLQIDSNQLKYERTGNGDSTQLKYERTTNGDTVPTDSLSLNATDQSGLGKGSATPGKSTTGSGILQDGHMEENEFQD